MLQILNRLFREPGDSLTLVVGGARQRFSSISAFQKYLSQRIDMPDEIGRSALTRPDSQHVCCEASARKKALESHQDLVTKAMVAMLMHKQCIGPIDSRNFSRDHGWREIMEGLNEQTSRYDAFKYEALKMYTRYMEARSAFAETDDSEPASSGAISSRQAFTSRQIHDRPDHTLGQEDDEQQQHDAVHQ
jgi:hypothetical protein